MATTCQAASHPALRSSLAPLARVNNNSAPDEPAMNSNSRVLFLAWLICGCVVEGISATVTSRSDGDTCRLVSQGDERIELSFSRSQGLLNAPVTVRVDDRSFSFDGFYVAFNGEHDGYASKSVGVESEKDSLRVTHLLEHPRLPSP